MSPEQWLRVEDDLPRVTLTNPFTQSTWVYACVSAVAQQVAQTPFCISVGEPTDRSGASARKGGDSLVQSGPLIDLLERPHPQLDRFLFWELVIGWLLLRGQAFIIALDRNGNVLPINPARTVPQQLMLLNPDRVTTVIADHELLGYRFHAGARDLVDSRNLLPEEALSVRLANPFDCCAGQSPATVAALAAQTDYAAAHFMKGLMLSNADTGVFVTVPHEPSTEQRGQILAALRERRQRAGTPDRPLFLWSGAKIEKPALSMVDIHFLENRKFSRQEICAIYKTPQEILGFTEDANRAVAEAVRLNWIENTIAPLCERVAAAFSPLLRVHAPGRTIRGWFDIDSLPIMQKARQDRFRAARQGFEMGVPLGVLNDLFDLGLPALIHGETSYLPGTFQAIDEDDDARAKTFATLAAGTTLTAPLTTPKLQNSTTPLLYSALRARLSRFFFEQRGRVLALFFAGKPQLVNLRAENERLLRLMKPYLNGSACDEHVADINETTLQHLTDTLGEGKSESQEQRAARIRHVFQAAARERAPMLAKLFVNKNQTIDSH